jgi:hypothetical protein
MCRVSGIALVASYFVEKYTLDQAINTEQGFRDVALRGNGRPEDDVENYKDAVGKSKSPLDEKVYRYIE